MLIEIFRVNRWADNLFDICKLEIVQKIYKTIESLGMPFYDTPLGVIGIPIGI